MNFTQTIKEILGNADQPLTPQELSDIIKESYPQFYGTDTHIRNVRKENYKNLDHALLAQVYSTTKQSRHFFCDNSFKPIRISLADATPGSALKDVSGEKAPFEVSRTQSPPQTHPAHTSASNEDALIQNIDHYYALSQSVAKDFGGPSVYFHIEAVKAQEEDFLSIRHLEMVYATLASWGMHRMGDPNVTKAKLVDFDQFRDSILTYESELSSLYEYRMEDCSWSEYKASLEKLRDVYCALKVSISDATVVAHSKTLCHVLPNLIPPIDRQYTVRFFTQEYQRFSTGKGKLKAVVNLPAGIDQQFEAFTNYTFRIKHLLDRCDFRSFRVDRTFNTSYPKIIDNLIMAFVKSHISANKIA